jgi:hypothetical protein
MDTIPKFLNHVCVVSAVCNTFLILNSWTVSILPFFAAFLLGFQNACVLLILNNGKLVFSPRFLAPTDFMVGVSLGISIGATILAFFLSLGFRKVHIYCQYVDDEHACGDKKAGMGGIWWWSTLVFWLNMVICLLLAAGRHEISYLAQNQYETIGNVDSGFSMDQYEENLERFRANQEQAMEGMASGYVGNYATVPDVQSETP